tara:strand:- start:4 stop:1446 length:1443 start_codon:yes stop_codon:yes gene_type:complete
MKTLGDTLPRRFKAKASGSITAGKPLIVEADGDVTEISATGGGQDLGSAVVFESAGVRFLGSTFDSNENKIVIVYRDGGNSNYGTAVVGTVSGSTISFGTPVVYNSANSSYNAATFDSNANKVVVAYRDAGNSNRGTAIVGTVSGTSISFGSGEVFETGETYPIAATFDSSNNKVVIAYGDEGNSNYGKAIVGTVSGTSISFGSETTFNSGSTPGNQISASFDSNSNKVVITYRDGGNSSYGTAIVGTVSGTSISFGSETVFDSIYIDNTSSTFDSSNNKIVVTYQRVSATDIYAAVGTVSGTSISFGTPVAVDTSAGSYSGVVFEGATNKVVVSFDDNLSSNGQFRLGTVSGTSISFEGVVTFESVAVDYISSTLDSNSNAAVIAYKDSGNSNYGTAVAFRAATSNLTSENYIGIAEYAAADTETATVFIKGGVSPDQSSLTPGQTYFVQTDGTIATSAGTPSVTAGTAVTSTKLIVKG